ncbi:hypothetical protein [Streptomyces sp. NPDC057740]|uniref:hypothetical protein n=1 Tax=Streptomyces sp. NPDC057740 TaxID=3346234 RepID=UPI00369DF9DD
MDNRGNTGNAGATDMTATKGVRRRGISVLAVALLVALPVSAGVTVVGRGGPSVLVAVNGWQ